MKLDIIFAMNAVRIALLAGIAAVCQPAIADIVERSFTRSGREGEVSGYVLQGSHNMRRLGKSRTVRTVVVPSIVVPALEPVTVVPALETGPLQPKPRFGYGSDYRPEEVAADPEEAPDRSSSSPLFLKPAYSPGTYYSLPHYYSPGYYWGSPYSYFRPGCIHRYHGLSIFGRSGSVRFFFGF